MALHVARWKRHPVVQNVMQDGRCERRGSRKRMMSMRRSLCGMEVVLRSSGWVVASYGGHLPVYALGEAPERAWSTRKDLEDVACSDDEKQ